MVNDEIAYCKNLLKQYKHCKYSPLWTLVNYHIALAYLYILFKVITYVLDGDIMSPSSQPSKSQPVFKKNIIQRERR